jgi:hypothetical protein
MPDLHILDFHDDLLGRYKLALDVFPLLKKRGYKRIGLEGFVFGTSFEEYKLSIREEIKETKEMLQKLDMDNINKLCAFDSTEFSPTIDLYKEVKTELLLTISGNKQLKVTEENINTLLLYVESSLINRSTLHLIEQLETLRFELIPIEYPTTSLAFQKLMENSPREALTDDEIDPYNLAREQYYNQRFDEIKLIDQTPVIFFTGAFHHRAIQSTVTHLLFTSCKHKVPSDFKNEKIKLLDFSATSVQHDLRKALNQSLFSVSHYNKTSQDYMKYFQNKSYGPTKGQPPVSSQFTP